MNWKNFFKKKSPSSIKYTTTDTQTSTTTDVRTSTTTEEEAIQKLANLRLTMINYMKNLEKTIEKTPQSRAEFDFCQTILRKIQ